MIKGLKPIRTLIMTQLKNAEDEYERQQLRQTITMLNRAERSYNVYELYKELKNSTERVIIVDRETGNAQVATNAQIFKLSVMKEDLQHEQSVHEDASRGIGTSNLGDKAHFDEFVRKEACKRALLAEIVTRSKP